MSISDLTGTSWVFNDVLTSAGQTVYYQFKTVFFTIGETIAATGLSMTINNGQVLNLSYISTQGQAVQLYFSGQWLAPEFKKITISGGSEAANATLINFIGANATQIKHVNKVNYDSATLIDLTSDTIDASALLQGYTAHDATGAKIAGQMEEPVAMTSAEILAAVQAGWQ